MELLLLLCSSGVAGLFTYIYLDYLSLFDTEKEEIKKMFSIMFSLISIGIFLLTFRILDSLVANIFCKTFLSLIAMILIIWLLNKYIYPKFILFFRKSMNKTRTNNNLNPLSDKHAIDTILQTSDMFYIEKYKDNNNEPIYQGILLKHEITNELDSIFSIKPTPVIQNDDKVLKKYYYQPKNTDAYYKIYSLEN